MPGKGPPSSPSKKAELVFWLSSNLQALPRAEQRLLAEIRVCLPLHFFLPRVRFLVKVLRIPLLLSIGLHFTILPLLAPHLSTSLPRAEQKCHWSLSMPLTAGTIK